jgi:hypothetical protein
VEKFKSAGVLRWKGVEWCRSALVVEELHSYEEFFNGGGVEW